MIQTDNLVQWQLYDSEVDAIYPWFTHPFLEWLKTQDFSNKRVLEFGGGRSSRWWRKKAAWVTTIDANPEWANIIEKDCEGLDNGVIISRQINEGDQSRAEEYVNLGDEYGDYDVVVNDGILRFEVLQKALSMKKPLLLIADNWKQSYVWISPPSEYLMEKYEIHIFEQLDHSDNDGINKWKTVYWELK